MESVPQQYFDGPGLTAKAAANSNGAADGVCGQQQRQPTVSSDRSSSSRGVPPALTHGFGSFFWPVPVDGAAAAGEARAVVTAAGVPQLSGSPPGSAQASAPGGMEREAWSAGELHALMADMMDGVAAAELPNTCASSPDSVVNTASMQPLARPARGGGAGDEEMAQGHGDLQRGTVAAARQCQTPGCSGASAAGGDGAAEDSSSPVLSSSMQPLAPPLLPRHPAAAGRDDPRTSWQQQACCVRPTITTAIGGPLPGGAGCSPVAAHQQQSGPFGGSSQQQAHAAAGRWAGASACAPTTAAPLLRLVGSDGGGASLFPGLPDICGRGSSPPPLPQLCDPAVSGQEEEDALLQQVLPQLTAELEQTVGLSGRPVPHAPGPSRHNGAGLHAGPGQGYLCSSGMGLTQQGRCVVTGHLPHAATPPGLPRHMQPPSRPGGYEQLPGAPFWQQHSQHGGMLPSTHMLHPGMQAAAAMPALGNSPHALPPHLVGLGPRLRLPGGFGAPAPQYPGVTTDGSSGSRFGSGLKLCLKTGGVPVTLPGHHQQQQQQQQQQQWAVPPSPAASAAWAGTVTATAAAQPLKRPRGRPRKTPTPGTPQAAAAAAAPVPEAALAAFLHQQPQQHCYAATHADAWAFGGLGGLKRPASAPQPCTARDGSVLPLSKRAKWTAA